VGYKPISDYGVIGDMHSAALVGKDGSIDWLCFPRFDSPSVFAALLDEERGGRFSIAPLGFYESSSAYLDDSNVLITTFETQSGVGKLTDFMPIEYEVTRSSHEVVRIISAESGSLDILLAFQPRLDYGRSEAPISLEGDRLALAARDGERLFLSSDVPLTLEERGATARFSLSAGQKATFLLGWRNGTQATQANDGDIYGRLGRTQAFWRFVAQDWRYYGRWQEVIKRSMLALHLLLYAPTGAVSAAVTTSLPTNLGGVRNWDYRFSWLRDAAFTMDIFNRLGHTAYSRPFIEWLAGLLLSGEEMVHPFYRISPDAGPLAIQEEILPGLIGYMGSSPVRIGNAAYDQFQLDIYGEVLIALDSYQRAGGRIEGALWTLVEFLVEAAIRNWQKPDSGIWEMRSEPKHFVYSKLMAWVAVDRGLRLARALRRPIDFTRWEKARAEMRQDIFDRGWDPARETFVQFYGSKNVDASVLFMPMVGFLPAEDPRMASTIDKVCTELAADGFVRRYNTWETDDGIAGEEGVFTLCTLWLAGVLIVSGRLDEGQRIMERVLKLANPLGLYSEMVDPESGEFLGNYPQGLTHIGLIHTARNLDRALNKVETGKVVAA